MKAHYIRNRMFAAGTAVFTVLSLAASARADGVNTSDPSLPVVYPTGQYLSPQDVHAMYSGPGLAVVLSMVQHRAFAPVDRTPSGPNEIEHFNSTLDATISANGGPNDHTTANGPVQTEVFGKIGNVTGTFNTEMLSMDLSGSSAIYGPYMIRESPTLQSLGQTTITDIGGGMYHIDSFFDVFTELSVDGGASWIPSQGSTRVNLEPVPEPSVCALAGLAGLLGLWRIRGFRRQS